MLRKLKEAVKYIRTRNTYYRCPKCGWRVEKVLFKNFSKKFGCPTCQTPLTLFEKKTENALKGMVKQRTYYKYFTIPKGKMLNALIVETAGVNFEKEKIKNIVYETEGATYSIMLEKLLKKASLLENYNGHPAYICYLNYWDKVEKKKG